MSEESKQLFNTELEIYRVCLGKKKQVPIPLSKLKQIRKLIMKSIGLNVSSKFCEKHQMYKRNCREWQKKGMLDECEEPNIYWKDDSGEYHAYPKNI